MTTRTEVNLATGQTTVVQLTAEELTQAEIQYAAGSNLTASAEL